MMFGRLLHTFNKLSHTFDSSHSHNMLTIQEYYAIVMYIALYLNHEKLFIIFEIGNTIVINCVTSLFLIMPEMMLQHFQSLTKNFVCQETILFKHAYKRRKKYSIC